VIELKIVEVDPQGEDAQALLREAAVEARALYPELFDSNAPWPTNGPTPARGFYLVAYRESKPVASGAVRPLQGNVAEVRRIFVTQFARKHGIARKMLSELEARAQRSGYDTLRLETGYKQEPAIRLYESHGYLRIRPFCEYAGDPTSVCFEKTLGRRDDDA